VKGQTGTIILNVEGVDLKKGGLLSAGVFNEPNFLDVGKEVMGLEVMITSDKMQLRLTDVPAGTYGVAILQDVDKNKALTTNFIGIPKEPIGFSNNPRIRFGPPSFEDAKFNVEKDKQTTLTITLR